MMLTRGKPDAETAREDNLRFLRVPDIESATILGALAAGAGFFALFFFPHPIAAVPGAIGVYLFLIARNRSIGFEFDFEKGTVTFPGGGVAATDESDLTTLRYWFQSAYRMTIRIADITIIETDNTFDIYTDTKGNVQSEMKHTITFSGAFGTASYSCSRVKRNQIVAAFTENNALGIPIVER